MKIIGVSLAALAVCGSVAPAYAQQQEQTAQAVETPQVIESVTVTARRFKITPQDYEYAYTLSNGEIARFSRKVGRYYVSVKGQPKVEIFSTAADRFVTKGGAKLVFTEGGEALTIDNFEQLQIESGLPIASLAAAKK